MLAAAPFWRLWELLESFAVRPHPFKCKATAGAAVVLWLTTGKRNARQGTKRFWERNLEVLLVCWVFYLLLIRPYVLNLYRIWAAVSKNFWSVSKQPRTVLVTLLLPLSETQCCLGLLCLRFIIRSDCLLLGEEKASGAEKISDTLIFLD